MITTGTGTRAGGGAMDAFNTRSIANASPILPPLSDQRISYISRLPNSPQEHNRF